MKEYTYKKMGIDDLELLVSSRVMVLRAANKLPEDTDMSEIEKQSREYYKKAFAEDSHTAYLVFDGDRLIGIISHVSELRGEIDKQIVVTKNKVGGSEIEIIS